MRTPHPETKVIMSSEPGIPLGARDGTVSRSSSIARRVARPSSGRIVRCDDPMTSCDHDARSTVRRSRAPRERVRITAARGVLAARRFLSPTPRALVVAAPSDATRRATASFVENFSLAEERASDGINHVTVRDESTPRVRTESIPPITQSTGRQESSSRVTPSRLTVLSPMFPRARPSRSDRTSVGCRTSEDQGGPQ